MRRLASLFQLVCAAGAHAGTGPAQPYPATGTTTDLSVQRAPADKFIGILPFADRPGID